MQRLCKLDFAQTNTGYGKQFLISAMYNTYIFVCKKLKKCSELIAQMLWFLNFGLLLYMPVMLNYTYTYTKE